MIYTLVDLIQMAFYLSFLIFFQVKSGVDEESEATLLTALTEILDSVDDENLSPFDTLPDMELLQGQKDHDYSPVSMQLYLFFLKPVVNMKQ